MERERGANQKKRCQERQRERERERDVCTYIRSEERATHQGTSSHAVKRGLRN